MKAEASDDCKPRAPLLVMSEFQPTNQPATRRPAVNASLFSFSYLLTNLLIRVSRGIFAALVGPKPLNRPVEAHRSFSEMKVSDSDKLNPPGNQEHNGDGTPQRPSSSGGQFLFLFDT